MRSTAVALVLMSAFVVVGCGGSSAKPPTGAECTLNSQCNQPLVCTFGKCHAACNADTDCPTGALCVKTTSGADGGVTGNVCQLPAELKCVYNSQCALPLVCARDEQCRNQCQASVDCVNGQICTTSGVCATQDQLVAGTNDVQLVTAGMGGAGGQATAGSGGGAAGAAGGAAGTGTATGGAGGHAGSAGGHAGGAGGAAGGAAGSSGGCGSGCGVNMQCVSGTCEPCGHSGEACCDGICGANLLCSTDTAMCTCGGASQPCCNGTTCTSGLACVTTGATSVCQCGGAGQTCCTGKTCSNSSLLCGGLTCGCTKGCDQSSYWKTDGSVWYQNSPYSNLDGSLFKAISYSWNSSFACGVTAGGSAYCWGSDNYGQLGNAQTTNMTFTYPQAVVMDATAQTPLTGITSIAVSDYGNTACAVGAAGAVYCWGYGTQGQLGNGTMGNYNYAVPVTLDVNQTMPFTGAATLSLSYQHTCALMTDKSLWCWGDNSEGEIGVGSTATTIPNPVQITTLMKNVTSVVTSYGQSSNTCASTTDGKAYCWGYNYYGATGDGTFTAGNAPVRLPGSAVMLDASTVMTGVAQVLDWNAAYKLCALKTDGTIWCWGNNAAGSYATHLLDNTQTAIAGVTIAGRSCYLDSNDLVNYNNYKASYQLTCN